MNITVNIPALDRLCDLIESGKLSFAQAETPAKTEAPVKTKKAKTSPEPASDPAPVVEATTPPAEEVPQVTTPEPAPVVAETPAPAPTAEQAADLARAVVKLSSVSHLRNLLDLHIGTGVRITEADKGKIPALVDALNAELNKLNA